MNDHRKSEIFRLISDLRERTGRSFEAVRKFMGNQLYGEHSEYPLDRFNAKFRREDRHPPYELDELVALIEGFNQDVGDEKRCTAYDAIQLFDLTGMSLSDHWRLKDLFGPDEYLSAWDQYQEELGLKPATVDQADEDVIRRQQEFAYLDRLMDLYRFWKNTYASMSAVAQEPAPREHDDLIDYQTAPVHMVADFDQFFDEELNVRRQLNAHEELLTAVHELRQVMLLGEPGSGKSTTLQRLAADLAEQAQQNPELALPVLVELGKVDSRQSLHDLIKAQLGELALWQGSLEQGRRLAFLLDGLNEIPRPYRVERLNEIRALVNTALAAGQWIVISCRELDYGHDLDTGLPRRLIIKPLDPLRIRQFIHVHILEPADKRDELFWALAGDEARRFWERFLAEVGDRPDWFWLNEDLPAPVTWGYSTGDTRNFYWQQWMEIRKRPGSLLHLARNPYLLFMMLRVFVGQHQIPANRAQLFAAFANYLLMRRENLSETEAQALIERLAALAYAMQQSDDPSSTSPPTAIEYLGNDAAFRAAQSASILEVSDAVRFTHQLLQAYFAALRLDGELRVGGSAPKYWPPASWWLASAWDDSAILLAGFYERDASPVITWLQDAAPEIAARCAAESGSHTPPALYDALAEGWVQRLDESPVMARAALGRALGILGHDPRPGVGLRADGLPDLDWVEIPGGDFIHGEGEKLQCSPFAIARYPVTYRQFQVFIEADDGYAQPAWWTACAYQEQVPGVQGFAYANHPRERVSWYDAMAYCAWLSQRLGYEVRLPTEYEWEKAARGPDGFIYPYGSRFDALRGNVDQTEIGQTTAVGLFPEGASPFGVLDLSGNVFEWCLNLAGSPDEIDLTSQERRSLRGGSWAHSPEHARADFRYANRPERRRNRIGFRLLRPA